MVKKITFVIIIVLLSMQFSQAQLGTNWKKIRHEAIVGVGTTNFLGELGGSNQYGTHFLRDFEIKSTRSLFHAGYRYKVFERMSVKGGLFFGWVQGADSLAKPRDGEALDPSNYRYDRNLSFRSPIVELSANVEYSILKERYGHRYDLRRVRGKRNTPNLYVFTGISMFYFNPKAKYEDEWVALQPLGTEGQGLVSTREKYNRVSFAVPLGFGMTYMLDRNWGMGFEYGVRYTFTDYIDDVSTTYVDPNLFDNQMAEELADPSINNWPGAGTLNQRGDDHYNDFYMFLTINATYKIRPRRPGLPKF